MDQESARLVKEALEAILQDSELARLSQQVEGAFQEATNKWNVPDAASCGMVALYLTALHQNPKRPKKRLATKNKPPKLLRLARPSSVTSGRSAAR